MSIAEFFLDMGFEIPDKFVVGYALDYNEYFRDLAVSKNELHTFITSLSVNQLTILCHVCVVKLSTHRKL